MVQKVIIAFLRNSKEQEISRRRRMNTKQKHDTQKATILASELLTTAVLLCYLPLSKVSFLSNKHCYLPKNNQFRRSLLPFYCEIISPKPRPGETCESTSSSVLIKSDLKFGDIISSGRIINN